MARAARYWRRDRLRPFTSLTRVRKCGASTVTRGGGVTWGVRQDSDGSLRAGIAGVATCGSVWSCPQCSGVVAARRADEIAAAMRAVDARGGSAFLLTLTVKHTARDRLGWSRTERRRFAGLERRRKDRALARKLGDRVDEAVAAAEEMERQALLAAAGVWDAVSAGWAAVTSGKHWTEEQQRHGGLLGWCKVVEVTHGRNGWHAHVHVLLCFADDVTELDVAATAHRMFGRWQAKARAMGYDASGITAADGHVPGWDLRRAQLGDNALANYFTKLAQEVTGGHRKEGKRRGGVTPFTLAAAAAETYAERDMARWWEWESASDGRRQLTWSGGERSLRTLAGLGKEQTDEDVAEEEQHADERLSIAASVWGWLLGTGQVPDALDVSEQGNSAADGLASLAAWLDAHGQAYTAGVGVEWVEQPERLADEVIPSWHPGETGIRLGEVPVTEGIGRGWADQRQPATLRGTGADGRPRRRPSDRPPRWTRDARAVLPREGHA